MGGHAQRPHVSSRRVLPVEILACPHCERLFTVTPAVLGKKIRCRGCRSVFYVPRDTASVPLGSAVWADQDGFGDAPPPFAVAGVKNGRDVRSCPACGRTFAMKPSLAGKTIRCRGCKSPFRVTATVDGNSDAGLAQPQAQSSASFEHVHACVQPPPPPPRLPQSIAEPVAAAVPAISEPTVFEDVGDVLAGPLPGERVASVVRPRNASALAKNENEAIATLIALVFGAACALPVVQLILWWFLDQDPLSVGKALPDSLEWITPPRWRN